MTTQPPPKAFECVRMIERQGKPRTSGITYARDRGIGLGVLEGMLELFGEYIDILKLSGFSDRLMSKELILKKIELCRKYNVEVGLGGVMLEHALLQGPRVVKDFLKETQDMGIACIEVCRQVIIISLSHLLDVTHLINEHDIKPIAEVGVAYGISPDEEVYVDETKLIETMRRFHEAGAWKVLLESEGITESRYKKDWRWDVVSKVANTLDIEYLMFEADDRDVYTRYIKDYGPDVNLFVDITRVVHLEGSRRGGWGKHPVVNRVATFYR